MIASIIPESLGSVAILALLGSAVAFYNQIKNFIQRLFSFFIRTDKIISHHSGAILVENILKESKIIRWGNSEWEAQDVYLKDYKIWSYFLFRKENSIIVIFKNRIPLILKSLDSGVSITYFYKTLDINKLIGKSYQEAILFHLDETNRVKSSYYLQEYNGEDISTISNSPRPTNSSNTESKGINLTESNNSFSSYYLKNYGQYIGGSYTDIEKSRENIEQINFYWSKETLRLKNEVLFFKEHANWFFERQISYKMSALLSGPPGTGKSKMIIEVAKNVGIPVKKINISNMSDKEFKENYYAHETSGTIILIEDIDAVFCGRTNLLAKNSLNKNLLSFDTLINTISGVKELNGIFLIMTSNFIDKLDPALIRPGRLDLKIEVGNLDFEGRKFVAGNILKDFPEKIDFVVAKYENCTVAEFEAHCKEVAIEEFYKKYKNANI